MTDRFKKCHDEITMAMAKDTTTPKKIKRDIITTHTLLKNVFIINEALTLAQEAEQLRKERDELAKAVVASSGLTSWGKQEKYMSEYADTIKLAKKVNENGNA